jgi:hypothetical protein
VYDPKFLDLMEEIKKGYDSCVLVNMRFLEVDDICIVLISECQLLVVLIFTVALLYHSGGEVNS